MAISHNHEYGSHSGEILANLIIFMRVNVLDVGGHLINGDPLSIIQLLTLNMEFPNAPIPIPGGNHHIQKEDISMRSEVLRILPLIDSGNGIGEIWIHVHLNPSFLLDFPLGSSDGMFITDLVVMGLCIRIPIVPTPHSLYITTWELPSLILVSSLNLICPKHRSR